MCPWVLLKRSCIHLWQNGRARNAPFIDQLRAELTTAYIGSAH
jgi:hypothetical protein